MDVVVLTSLYPSAVRPYEGLFAERRWTRMRARGHAVRVVQPLPRALAWLGRGAWREIAQMRSEERAGIPIDRPRYWHVPGRSRANARAFVRAGLARLDGLPRPDVVVADYAWPAAAAAGPLRARGLPFVVHGRGSDVLQVAGEAGLGADLAEHLATAGHWAAVSADLVRAMDALGGRQGRGVLVPNGVDLERFRLRSKAESRAGLGLAAGGELVLVVGHLIPRKDPLLALDVFARASTEGRLAFVGRGPLEGELEAEVARRGLAERVILAGEQPPERLDLWYGAADALLLTSHREGRPNVVLEALACGRPVVATEAGGTAELVEGLDGMLARSRDPEAVAALLRARLDTPDAPERLRRHAAGFSWERSLDELERCLDAAVRDLAEVGA